MNAKSNKVDVAVLGASGYTGAELVRLLVGHAYARIVALTAERRAGARMDQVFPHLGGIALPPLVRLEAVDWDQVDFAFCCLPHGTTHDVVAGLPRNLKVVDLSADFRLADVDVYAQWYGQAHRAPELQTEAVYGLTEIAREAIAGARLVANPGCYPTSAQLPLIPLIEAGMIATDDIIIDAKSGVTGAGRAATEAMLFAEVGEGVHAYGVASHRHAPEIEQGLSQAAGAAVTVNFTPHLMPMNRGILSTIYVRLAPGADAEDLREALGGRYRDEPFVRVLDAGAVPATRHVRGSNHCLIGVHADRLPGRAIVLTVIDNLVKGAAGQALQNMNVMCGFPETAGLTHEALFP